MYSNRPSRRGIPGIAPIVFGVNGKPDSVRDPFTPSPVVEAAAKSRLEARTNNLKRGQRRMAVHRHP